MDLKTSTFIFASALIIQQSCSKHKNTETQVNIMDTKADSISLESGYSDVNGMKMYYEIYKPSQLDAAEQFPLVLIHGGGSTIESTFGRIIPILAKNRQLIAVEMQAHGRTSDRANDLSFEQDADDVAALLKNINVAKADFFGFSNGGTTALQIGMRHPQLVHKIIAASTITKRSGAPDSFWSFMKQARLENMPEQLKEAYRMVAADPKGLRTMHDKDAKRMVDFKDIPDEQIESIQAPTLIIIGDEDVVTPEHATEMHRLISDSELAVLPGGHGDYLGEITTLESDYKEGDFAVPMIENFLDKK